MFSEIFIIKYTILIIYVMQYTVVINIPFHYGESSHCPKSREQFLSHKRDVTIKTTTGKK